MADDLVQRLRRQAADEDLLQTLRQQAEEIAEAGHNGWGNTMTESADAIARKDAEIAELRMESARIEKENREGWKQAAHWRERAERAEARVDALMLEYCPGEMTDEQRKEWAKCQEISNG